MPIIIKGCPRDKWEEVQAIQHEPFIYIHHNGSHWAGQEPDDVTILVEVLESHKLRDDYGNDDFGAADPCVGVVNPDWDWSASPDVPHYIDGPRMYAADGVRRFSGNFENLSHAFCVDTNHEPTIKRLFEALQLNRKLVSQ